MPILNEVECEKFDNIEHEIERTERKEVNNLSDKYIWC